MTQSTPPDLAKPRPVTLAILFTLGAGLAGAIQAINAYAEKRTVTAGLAEAGKYMNLDQAIYRTTNLRGSLSLALVLGICALVLFAPVSLLIANRVPWARIAGWIIGIALIAGEAVLMTADSSAVKTGKFVLDIDVPGGDAQLVDRLNGMLVPGWFPPVHYAAELAALVCLVGACIQLARSSEYFRREEPDSAEDDRVWSTTRMRTTKS